MTYSHIGKHYHNLPSSRLAYNYSCKDHLNGFFLLNNNKTKIPKCIKDLTDFGQIHYTDISIIRLTSQIVQSLYKIFLYLNI